MVTRRTDIFKLTINNKPVDSGSIANVTLNKEHELSRTQEKVVTYSGKELTLDGEGKRYLMFGGEYPKKLKQNNIVAQISVGDRVIKDNLTVTNGIFDLNNIELRDVQNLLIGKLRIFTDNQGEYIKLGFGEWNAYRGNISTNVEIRYLIKENNGSYKELRTDVIKLVIVARDEQIPDETIGGIFVYNAGYLNEAQLTDDGNGKLKLIWDREGEKFNPDNQAQRLGEFPKKFIPNLDTADWGDSDKVNIHFVVEEEKNYQGDIAVNKKDGLFDLFKGNSDAQLEIAGGEYTDFGKKVKLGLRAVAGNDYLEMAIFQFNANKTMIRTIAMEYQAWIGGKWVTKKTDKLKIIVQPSLNIGKPEVNLNSPIVWYDYTTSSAISNINHDKLAKVVGRESTTYSRGGGVFTKNQYKGKQWIDVKDISEYNLFYRHRVDVSSKSGEVTKYTDSQGKTQSSTFVSLNEGNSIMVSYDGNGEKRLNIGISSYDFEGMENGEVVITNYNQNEEIVTRDNIKVSIPKFNGLPYVNETFDIKPEIDYVKDYTFDQPTNTDEVKLEYGEVGFKDLDIRITQQYKGKRVNGQSIELRVKREVYLIGEGEFEGYKIPATLEFRNPINRGRNKEKYTSIMGENEKTTKDMLILTIPSQEYLIPQGRFKIVDREDTTKSPLEIGVTVKQNNKEYFNEVTNLYLNLTEKRLIKADIIFRNPDLATEISDKWIKLNKTNYSGGRIDNFTGAWGRVEGDVVDIPTRFENMELEVFDSGYNKIQDTGFQSENGGEITIGQNKIKFRLMKGNSYIEFKPTNPTPYNIGEEGVFYVRYKVGEQYLFTQRFRVIFQEKTEVIGDTEVRFKNPMMLGYLGTESGTGVMRFDNWIGFDNGSEILYSGNGNHNTKQDSQKWWEINRIAEYPMYDEYTIYDLYYDEGLTQKLNYTEKAGYRVYEIENFRIGFMKLGKGATIGIVEVKASYQGEGLKKDLYLGTTIKNTQTEVEEKRIDRIELKIDSFDPTYYGKAYPVNNDDTSSENYKVINYVGEGIEQLGKTNISDYMYIDLGTNYRDYMRYEGIIKDINKTLQIKTLGEVTVQNENGTQYGEIKGEVLFVEESDVNENGKSLLNITPSKNDTTPVTPKNYKLKLKLTKEMYLKLQENSKYNIYFEGNKNIFEIGFINGTGANFIKRLELDKPLSFRTTSPFIIDAGILDFGEINIVVDVNKEKQASTFVRITGESLNNVELTLPKTETVIKRVENGEIKEDTLTVTNLNLEENKGNNTKTETKNYILNGSLTVPEDTTIGEYWGDVVVDVTLIN